MKIKSCLGGASAVKQRGAGSKVFRRRVAVLETKIRTLLLHCGRNTSYKVCLSCRESKAWRLAKEFSFADIRQGPPRRGGLRKGGSQRVLSQTDKLHIHKSFQCIDSSRNNSPERSTFVGNIALAGQLVGFTAATASLLRIRRTPLVVMASKLDVNSCIVVMTNAL